MLRILYIEDNPLDIEVLKSHIASQDVDLQITTRLQDGLPLIDNMDIVVCDLSLPDSNEMQTIDSLSSVQARTCMMVLTGNEDPKISRYCGQRGIYYVPKQTEKLYLFLENAIGLWEHRQQIHRLIDSI